MDSLGEPGLVGLTKEEQDAAGRLLEPTISQGKRPLVIPDFISSFPIILQDDRETVLGTSGDAKIILKSSQDKKPSLDKIPFPRWSSANFRIMHILKKDSLLSSTQAIFNYNLYSFKISECTKCYPLSKVMGSGVILQPRLQKCVDNSLGFTITSKLCHYVFPLNPDLHLDDNKQFPHKGYYRAKD
ncbi:hypothetical protein P5673_019029 [Acropora cervicornis]|uniref:Uncharacterized protein n=1 Tax=Acropora cervicornis TaxID=6130 RepID=A0AAD9V2F5_ACRCE|nr:hypothetical protein P5673_019029 [Acropora cervicornis]